MDRKLCAECGALVTGADCVECSSPGKTEALAMVAILVSIALVLTGYVLIKFM